MSNNKLQFYNHLPYQIIILTNILPSYLFKSMNLKVSKIKSRNNSLRPILNESLKISK